MEPRILVISLISSLLGVAALILSYLIHREFNKQNTPKVIRLKIPLAVYQTNTGHNYVSVYKMHNYPIPMPFMVEKVCNGVSSVFYSPALDTAIELAMDFVDELDKLHQEPKREFQE